MYSIRIERVPCRGYCVTVSTAPEDLAGAVLRQALDQIGEVSDLSGPRPVTASVWHGKRVVTVDRVFSVEGTVLPSAVPGEVIYELQVTP